MLCFRSRNLLPRPYMHTEGILFSWLTWEQPCLLSLTCCSQASCIHLVKLNPVVCLKEALQIYQLRAISTSKTLGMKRCIMHIGKHIQMHRYSAEVWWPMTVQKSYDSRHSLLPSLTNTPKYCARYLMSWQRSKACSFSPLSLDERASKISSVSLAVSQVRVWIALQFSLASILIAL